MKPFQMLPIALCLLSPLPAHAQDFVGQFERFVEQLVEPEPAPAAPQKPKPAPEMAPVSEVPPVPLPRPEGLGETDAVAEPAVEAEPAPVEPPEPEVEPEAPEAEVVPPVTEPVVEAQPERVYQAACPAVIRGLGEARMVPPLREGACGELSPLEVTAVLVNGRMVPLSSPVTTNCQMASALPAWLSAVDGYAGAALESELAEVVTGTSYMCRNRNNASSGFTSEHGFANALDVTGFTLADGRSISVLEQWMPAAAPEGRLLRLAHDAACAGFTTVLGPEANAEHQDHLHVDLGCHGQTCTARLCE